MYNEKLLSSLLEHAGNSKNISYYLDCEEQYLKKSIVEGGSVIDFGCGYGRHLQNLENTISYGLGIDTSNEYVDLAKKNNKSNKIVYSVGDACRFTTVDKFSSAICMYNTIGNIENKASVISSMKNSIKINGEIIISVFSDKSIHSRLEMYENMGLKNPRVLNNKIVTDENFWSYHFTKKEAQELIPSAKVHECSEYGWIVHL